MTKLTGEARQRIAAISGACDSHVHVFEPARFPYHPARSYTPPEASCAALAEKMSVLGLTRCVLVQPSVYGDDNRCLLDALARLGPETARGVAVVDPLSVTDAVLADLHAAGVRAIRINFEAGGSAGVVDRRSVIKAAIRRMRGAGMAVQLYVDIETAATAIHDAADATVNLILDHHAGFKAGTDLDSPAFRTLLEGLRHGNIWVKLSAPYRTGATAPHYEALRSATEAMIEAAPYRMVWASDWPHTGGGAGRAGRDPAQVEPFRQIDDAADLERLRLWVADDARLAHILSTNPAKIFDFPKLT